MARLIWTESALADIDALAAYIARDSLHHAKRVVQRILALEASILDAPLIGRVVPEFGHRAIRERFVFSWRVVYRLDGEQIAVLAVIHGHRRLTAIADRVDA